MERENEIVKREGQSFIERLIENTDSLEKVKEVGMVIINSGFCPQHFKDSKDAVGAIMCIEAGRKLGLSWMQSLSDIYPVKGRIGIMGTAAKAVIFASGILESWKEYTEGEYPNKNYRHITVSKRKDLPDEFKTEFSVFDAETAGLMQKDIYKKYGKRMIAWRDIGFHASDYYQDILKGMKTVEELNDYDGLVPGTPEKITLKTDDGKEITFTDKDKEQSKKSTSRVAAKIPDNKFGSVGQDTQYTEAMDEKFEPQTTLKEVLTAVAGEAASIVPQRGSYSSDANEGAGEGIPPSIQGAMTDGKFTLAEMEKMETSELLKIINGDMDTMESMEMIPGKNTNKKLRYIIDAHQNGTLAEHVAAELPKPEELAKGEGNLSSVNETDVIDENIVGVIHPNKLFDQQAKPPVDNFLDNAPKKEEKKPEAGNKYGIIVSETTPRDFSEIKAIFNKLMGITPQITTPVYMTLSQKLGLFTKYPDREVFLKFATGAEINLLLNNN